MDDSAFDQALDALVAGHQPEQQDDLTRFVAGVYRKERDVSMPTHHRLQIATALELDKPTVISRGISYPGLEKRRSGKFAWLAIAAAALLAMTGVFNWSLPRGGDEGRFLGVPSAIPTVQATPVVMFSPNAEWLMPISPYECTLTENQVVTPTASLTLVSGDFPARVYAPLQLANAAERTDVWSAARDMRACLNAVGVETFWSDRLRYEETDRVFSVSAEAQQLSVDQIVHGQQVSDFYLNQLGVTSDQMLLHFKVGDPEVEGLDPGTYPVINPDWILQTEDGRQIVLVTAMVVSDGEMPLVTPESPPGAGHGLLMAWWESDNHTGFGAGVLIFIEADGGWLLDETWPFAGECDEVWEEWATALPVVDTAVATPTAVASPGIRSG
ncbi:MAG: hypothetical protein M9950_02335 [Thermomicrobiales bacterium]|nr:hypothetical protein [Thermomicrobiales bacterium]